MDSKVDWSEEEDIRLCQAQKKFGNKWTRISKLMPGRTTNVIRHRFCKILKDEEKYSSLMKENVSLSSDTDQENSKHGSEDETDDLPESSELCVEDDMERVPTRINSKLQIDTNKNSCEMLSNVEENIQQQLRDIDSKMHEDMGKFSDAYKSKWKHLESQFDGNQERFRLSHEKYKEEFNHYLLNCRSTLEELEAQRVEISVTSQQQKIMHREHLLQLEETVKDQLDVVETRISTVIEDVSSKLNNLRFAVNEVLNDKANG